MKCINELIWTDCHLLIGNRVSLSKNWNKISTIIEYTYNIWKVIDLKLINDKTLSFTENEFKKQKTITSWIEIEFTVKAIIHWSMNTSNIGTENRILSFGDLRRQTHKKFFDSDFRYYFLIQCKRQLKKGLIQEYNKILRKKKTKGNPMSETFALTNWLKNKIKS